MMGFSSDVLSEGSEPRIQPGPAWHLQLCNILNNADIAGHSGGVFEVINQIERFQRSLQK
jgi:hypothetical protein